MPHYNVLFLCTGNSARSIFGEALLNYKGRPNFTAYSAGSHPTGAVHQQALKQIQSARLSTMGLRSKSWDEFAKPDAPKMDFVFTVCDNAAKEVCPLWPGQPLTAHWGVPDPAAVTGTPEAVERGFRNAFSILQRRIELFLCLPLASLNQLAIQKEIDPDRRAMTTSLPRRVTAGIHGNGVSGGSRSGLRKHGRTAGGRQRRRGAAGEHGCHRGRTGSADSRPSNDFGRSFQSRRYDCRCI